jgi:hypothetical protein
LQKETIGSCWIGCQGHHHRVGKQQIIIVIDYFTTNFSLVSSPTKLHHLAVINQQTHRYLTVHDGGEKQRRRASWWDNLIFKPSETTYFHAESKKVSTFQEKCEISDIPFLEDTSTVRLD